MSLAHRRFRPQQKCVRVERVVRVQRNTRACRRIDDLPADRGGLGQLVADLIANAGNFTVIPGTSHHQRESADARVGDDRRSQALEVGIGVDSPLHGRVQALPEVEDNLVGLFPAERFEDHPEPDAGDCQDRNTGVVPARSLDSAGRQFEKLGTIRQARHGLEGLALAQLAARSIGDIQRGLQGLACLLQFLFAPRLYDEFLRPVANQLPVVRFASDIEYARLHRLGYFFR